MRAVRGLPSMTGGSLALIISRRRRAAGCGPVVVGAVARALLAGGLLIAARVLPVAAHVGGGRLPHEPPRVAARLRMRPRKPQG